MKRIIIATTPKKNGEKTNLLFPISFLRNHYAYLPSMNIDIETSEAEKFQGVISSYYLFVADSFQDLKDFVETEKIRMDECALEEKDHIYIAQIDELIKSFKCENELSNKLCANYEEVINEKLKSLEAGVVSENVLCELKKRQMVLKEKYFLSDTTCKDYLQNILKKVKDQECEISEMRFNFI